MKVPSSELEYCLSVCCLSVFKTCLLCRAAHFAKQAPRRPPRVAPPPSPPPRARAARAGSHAPHPHRRRPRRRRPRRRRHCLHLLLTAPSPPPPLQRGLALVAAAVVAADDRRCIRAAAFVPAIFAPSPAEGGRGARSASWGRRRRPAKAEAGRARSVPRCAARRAAPLGSAAGALKAPRSGVWRRAAPPKGAPQVPAGSSPCARESWPLCALALGPPGRPWPRPRAAALLRPAGFRAARRAQGLLRCAVFVCASGPARALRSDRDVCPGGGPAGGGVSGRIPSKRAAGERKFWGQSAVLLQF